MGACSGTAPPERLGLDLRTGCGRPSGTPPSRLELREEGVFRPQVGCACSGPDLRWYSSTVAHRPANGVKKRYYVHPVGWHVRADAKRWPDATARLWMAACGKGFCEDDLASCKKVCTFWSCRIGIDLQRDVCVGTLPDIVAPQGRTKPRRAPCSRMFRFRHPQWYQGTSKNTEM